jgi:hypothetical protein
MGYLKRGVDGCILQNAGFQHSAAERHVRDGSPLTEQLAEILCELLICPPIAVLQEICHILNGIARGVDQHLALVRTCQFIIFLFASLGFESAHSENTLCSLPNILAFDSVGNDPGQLPSAYAPEQIPELIAHANAALDTLAGDSGAQDSSEVARLRRTQVVPVQICGAVILDSVDLD